ncbi:hypothetical protein L2E82_02158 [Cichorium intybus]|uniref:Uncharacterized protein n=1 Tax=Cichorium intybus TaxID=13427 RepID=A0ACB9H2G0_CICIN|nr:hypothetical protein L2E82_02158 [Cichorium intybus]
MRNLSSIVKEDEIMLVFLDIFQVLDIQMNYSIMMNGGVNLDRMMFGHSNSYRFASGSTSEKSGTPKPRSACSKITQSIKQDNQADL